MVEAMAKVAMMEAARALAPQVIFIASSPVLHVLVAIHTFAVGVSPHEKPAPHPESFSLGLQVSP